MPDNRPTELTCPGCEGMSTSFTQPDCELCGNTGLVLRGVFDQWGRLVGLKTAVGEYIAARVRWNRALESRGGPSPEQDAALERTWTRLVHHAMGIENKTEESHA